MPRNRTGKAKAPQESPATPASETTSDTSSSTTTTTQRGYKKMALETLDASEIAELQASARGRGEYDRVLVEFINSEAPGARVPLDEGAFAGKKANSVKTGFTNAIGREKAPPEAKNVQVIVSGEKVYLTRRDMA